MQVLAHTQRALVPVEAFAAPRCDYVVAALEERESSVWGLAIGHASSFVLRRRRCGSARARFASASAQLPDPTSCLKTARQPEIHMSRKFLLDMQASARARVSPSVA